MKKEAKAYIVKVENESGEINGYVSGKNIIVSFDLAEHFTATKAYNIQQKYITLGFRSYVAPDLKLWF